jgi:hypothetical protein
MLLKWAGKHSVRSSKACSTFCSVFVDRTKNDKVRCWRQLGGGLKCVVRGKADWMVRVPDVIRDIACWPGMAGYLGKRYRSSGNNNSKKQASDKISQHYPTHISILRYGPERL